jgi:hypothetical protein
MRDHHYLFPLLGTIAAEYPKEAAALAQRALTTNVMVKKLISGGA